MNLTNMNRWRFGTLETRKGNCIRSENAARQGQYSECFAQNNSGSTSQCIKGEAFAQSRIQGDEKLANAVAPTVFRRFGGLAIVAALILIGAAALASPSVRGEKWTTMVKGTELTGWHIEGSHGSLEKWHVKDGILSADEGQMCYLASDDIYGDYDLKLEFKIPAGGNSGVGIRFPKSGWPSIDGMEIQILDDAAAKNAKEPENGKCGSIYMHVAPKASPSKPAGEWNSMRILCKGSHLNAWINKIEVLDVDLDKETTNVGKGKLPLAKRPRLGQIGLQAHYDSVEFRKIEVKRLR